MSINKARPDIGDYQYGFSDDIQPVYKSQKGLNEAVVNHLSDVKDEPDWMREFRLEAYSIFKDKAKAMKVCINRFDDETKQAFMELYDKVDADFKMPVDQES